MRPPILHGSVAVWVRGGSVAGRWLEYPRWPKEPDARVKCFSKSGGYFFKHWWPEIGGAELQGCQTMCCPPFLPTSLPPVSALPPSTSSCFYYSISSSSPLLFLLTPLLRCHFVSSRSAWGTSGGAFVGAPTTPANIPSTLGAVSESALSAVAPLPGEAMLT